MTINLTPKQPIQSNSQEAAEMVVLADRLEKLAKVGFGYDINDNDRTALRKAATALSALPAPAPAADLEAALTLAIGHIEHMAAWITKQNAGYSFESLGEDMPAIRDPLSRFHPKTETK